MSRRKSARHLRVYLPARRSQGMTRTFHGRRGSIETHVVIISVAGLPIRMFGKRIPRHTLRLPCKCTPACVAAYPLAVYQQTLQTRGIPIPPNVVAKLEEVWQQSDILLARQREMFALSSF